MNRETTEHHRARFKQALEDKTDWTDYRIELTLRHLMLALASNHGGFIVYSVGPITCGMWESTRELFLHAPVLVKVGPDFKATRTGTFTFKTEGPKFQGLLTPNKQGGTESNHRDKTCKRKQMRREGRRAKINMEELFTC